MAEAIGVISGVLGIAGAAIKVTTVLIDLIDKVKDAPQMVNDLQNQLQTLKIVLDEIDEVFPPKGGPSAPSMKIAIRDCTQVLEKLSEILKPLEERLNSKNCNNGKVQISWTKFQTAMMDTTITETVGRLDKTKLTLIIALVLTVGRSAKEQQSEMKVRFQLHRQGSTFMSINNAEAHQNPSRRDSAKIEIERKGSRRKAIFARAKASLRSDPETPKPQSSSREQINLSFSTILNNTLEKMMLENDPTSDNKDENETMQMLLHADLEKMQSKWSPNPRTIENLKRAINDYTCGVFTKSLKTPHYQQHGVKDAASSTCEWIKEDEEFKNWKESSESRLLHLCGKPASGKSVITKTVLQSVRSEVEKSSSNDTEVLYFFCNNRKRPEESSTNIMRALIYQFLKHNSTEFRRIVEACPSLLDHWDSTNPDGFEFTFDICWEIFCAMLDSPRKTKFYLFIDAMDECEINSAKEFLSELPGLFNSSRKAILKFYISSRPIVGIQNELSEISPIPLKIVLTHATTSADIAQIVENGLRKIKNNLNLEEDEMQDLKCQLVDRSDGMFLWAILAIQEIEKIFGLTAESLAETVKRLPSGLYDLYDCILNDLAKQFTCDGEGAHNKSSNVGESNLSLIWKIIQWVVRAGRPLTLKELRAAISIDLNDKSFEDTKKRMFKNIETIVKRIPFLEIVDPDDRPDDFTPFPTEENTMIEHPHRTLSPSSTVRLIHQSAKEYLLAYADRIDESADARGFELPKFDDASIAGLCVTFLKFKEFEVGPLRETSGGVPFKEYFQTFIESFDLLEYANAFWAYHLRRVAKPDTVLLALVCSFVCDLHDNVRLWCQVANFLFYGGHTDFVDDYFGLHVVAGEGIDTVVHYLIERGDDLNIRDQYGRTPYMMAALRGHVDTAQILEDAGADTNMRFPGFMGHELTELQKACTLCDTEQIATCIEAGDDVDERDESGRTALFYACSMGDSNCIKLLLDAGASVAVKDNHNRIPLDLALTTETRKEVIKRMQDCGIKCEKHHLANSSCTHFINENGTEDDKLCDHCGRVIWTFYYHCCTCCNEHQYEKFSICQDCWESGKRCLGESDSHVWKRRVIVDGLESWIEYTPHLADLKIVSFLDEVKKTKILRKVKAKNMWTAFLVLLRAMTKRARKLVSTKSKSS